MSARRTGAGGADEPGVPRGREEGPWVGPSESSVLSPLSGGVKTGETAGGSAMAGSIR